MLEGPEQAGLLRAVSVNPGAYAGVYRWRIIAIAATFAVAALMLGGTLTPRYESTAALSLEPIRVQEESESPETGEIDFATQASVARSIHVERIAATELKLEEEEAAGLAGSLSVIPIEETNILVFTYGHQDPETAEIRANVFAEAYLEFRRRVVAGEAIVQAAELEEKLGAVESGLKDALARSRRTNDVALRASLESFAGALEGVATGIEFDLSELADLPPVGEIVLRAEGSAKSSPNPLLNGGLGLMVGLVGGFFYASIRSRRDQRALSPEQLEASIGAPLLGEIPTIGGRFGRSLLVGSGSSRAAEAYRILRTNVWSVSETGKKLTIIVTSARPAEGKSITAANLALVIASSGLRVVLVSADARADGISGLFGVSISPGLTDVLTGKSSVDAAVVRARRNLYLLPGGSPADDPASLLGSPAMADLLAVLAERADLVIIDAPPVLGVADSAALAPLTDGMLFVVDARTASPEVVRLARDRLDRVKVRILGFVLNRHSATGRPGVLPRLRRVVTRREAA
jgi:capsular exopolysaccharide synthesis family protein